MILTWIAIAIFHVCSIGFVGAAILRTFTFMRRTRLEENKHTLLFSFLGIKQAIAIYAASIIIYTICSILFVNFLANQ